MALRKKRSRCSRIGYVMDYNKGDAMRYEPDDRETVYSRGVIDYDKLLVSVRDQVALADFEAWMITL